MLLDDFFTEYWPREETLEEIWGWVLSRTQGHLHLSGAPGSGKSWLVRGLAVGSQERGALPIYLEKSSEESFHSLVWRLVDAAEFMLDIDGELLRLVVSQALYESDASQAMLAAAQWLTQEVDGSFLLLLDGMDRDSDLLDVPSSANLPEGMYIVTSGRSGGALEQLRLVPEHDRCVSELRGYLQKRLAAEHQPRVPEILGLCQGNWRQAYYYSVLLKLGGDKLPAPADLYPEIFEQLSRKLGAELFRTVHLEILILLAIAQVPASLDLIRSWGVPSENIGFALFELRDLLTTDGEGSQYDALFTGEHYSLHSADLGQFLTNSAAWRDRVADAHRRAVARAFEPAGPTQGPIQDIDFYANCFAQYHLRESNRTADFKQLVQDPETVETCWNLARAAREQGYEEIGLQLFLVSAQLLEARQSARSRPYQTKLAEVYADCCHALTNQGRYSDGASFGERAVELVRPMLSNDPSDPLEGLYLHCLLCLADPFLYMGYVERARPLYTEAYERSLRESQPDQAKAIHALRGLARSSRAMGDIKESLERGEQALEMARKLTQEEGEEWAQYLFELLMEQSETMRGEREIMEVSPGVLESMKMRWESLALLREAEEQYHRFQWPGDQELVFLYLEQSMALFDLEKWSEAEERLTRAIQVINSLPDGDSHPADVASLEFLRSHALALMNRIGEASGSLANLLTPELMQEMDISEQALVLFFRAKILSHQGLLSQAETTLEESLEAYYQASELGAEDLLLEAISARIYLARVRARRGRLSQALELAEQCAEQLTELDGEDGLPALELADVSELLAWILLHQGRYSDALRFSESATEYLEQIRVQDPEADVETESSLNKITQAAIRLGLKQSERALALATDAVEIERRRAQEGYEQAPMWSAIHRLSQARVQRQSGLPDKALQSALQARNDLEDLPANQRNHLGLHVAAALTEIALGYIESQQWQKVRDPLENAISRYENEMWQSKDYLIATLLECHRHWLDFCRQSANTDWQSRDCWRSFFEGWGRWQAHIQEENDNVFLHQAIGRLFEWLQSLPADVQEEWNAAAPVGLQIFRTSAPPGL